MTDQLSKSLEIGVETSTSRRKKRVSISGSIQSFGRCQSKEGVDIEDSAVSICSCQQSASYPICDGTHHIVNRETKSNIQPVIIKVKSAVARLDSQTQTEDSLLLNSTTTVTSTFTATSKQIISTQEEEETREEKTNRSIQTEFSTLPKREIVQVNRKLITEEWTLEEIGQHNNEEDCWIIVNHCVYDITPYFDFHPGGKRALIKFAGKDATENVQFHSSKMLMLLNKYFYIGRVAGTSKKWQSCSIS